MGGCREGRISTKLLQNRKQQKCLIILTLYQKELHGQQATEQALGKDSLLNSTVKGASNKQDFLTPSHPVTAAGSQQQFEVTFQLLNLLLHAVLLCEMRFFFFPSHFGHSETLELKQWEETA